MKVQCACGAKYEFDLTPAMATSPVKFICPACRLDASEFVDGLVRQELGQTATPHGVPIPLSLHATSTPPQPAVTAAAPVGMLLEEDAAPPPPPPPPPRSGLAVRVHTPAAVAAAEAPAAASVAGTPCLKHPGQLAVEKCFICSKPLCPKCMEMFGYVCSPLCKAKADSHGIKVPIYAGQRDVVEARLWRKVVFVGTGLGAAFVALIGFWIWYTWSGRLPRPIFSIRFPELVSSGQAVICGKDKDQIVYLHGSILARHDMKHKKQLWSRDLIDTNEIQAEIAQEIKDTKALIDKANNEGWDRVPKMPDPEKLARQLARAQARALQLHVRGQNVWVGNYKKFVQYDWDSGQPGKQMAVRNSYFGGLISRGDDLLMIDAESSKPVVTRINLASGETTTQDLNSPEANAMAAASTTGAVVSATSKAPRKMAGLPTTPGADAGKPMDPGKVAEQVSHMPLPAKYALPATLSANFNQERTMAEMKDGDDSDPLSAEPSTSFSLIPTKDDFLQFAVKLKEARYVSHDAMKAPPKKSALDSGVMAADSMKVANEILNDMQRSRGGNMVRENVSLYQVTIRRPGSEDMWTGEVVGPPKLFPLDDINVLAVNKMIIVFDKHNKKLWQAPLTYTVSAGLGALDEESASVGRGPCVEHKGSLYVFDEGMLTAFDIATGNARWRLPSVGIAGMFFDDKDMIYLNTTTASPDSIKYSRQIDVSQQVAAVVQKVDSRNGKVIWTAEPGGMINYVSGQVILAVQSYQVMEDEDDESPYHPDTGFEASPYLRVRRINPRNGHEMWEHYQKRAPLDIAFEKNIIRVVFRKEVQVLKFPMF